MGTSPTYAASKVSSAPGLKVGDPAHLLDVRLSRSVARKNALEKEHDKWNSPRVCFGGGSECRSEDAASGVRWRIFKDGAPPKLGHSQGKEEDARVWQVVGEQRRQLRDCRSNILECSRKTAGEGDNEETVNDLEEPESSKKLELDLALSDLALHSDPDSEDDGQEHEQDGEKDGR